MKIINIYLIIINIVSLILMVTDKILAIKKKQRISEFHLLILSLFGGSIGTLLGMILVRHKIRKLKFLILVPLSLILHILIYLNL
ncbi:MAG: DUF1294 domain-containing protein [Bacilli bacterium]|nr:DUF1294 domain-containing protein [Bacilli bacterium]MBQ6840519.1 DUF1294 domain-containing protein [Bacilli bacterium]